MLEPTVTTCPALASADSDTRSVDKRASENTPSDHPLAANTSSEDKRQGHNPEHNQPEDTSALDKRRGEERGMGRVDYSHRTCSGYPFDATCESCGEYLGGRFVVERTVRIPEASMPSQAEQRPSSACHILSKPWPAADTHPSLDRHRRNNLVQPPSSESPSRASWPPVAFHHIRFHIPWLEQPSLELAAYTVVRLASVVADRPSSAGTATHRDPEPVEKSLVPERDETILEVDKLEHTEHKAA